VDARRSPRNIFKLNRAVFISRRVQTAGVFRNGSRTAGAQPSNGVNSLERRDIQFACTVPVAMRNAVECLFFFNPRQPQVIEQIRTVVESTGVPSVIQRDRRIWIGVPSDGMQCLFACDSDGKPVGVILYSRPAAELLVICHIAVDSEYALACSEGSGLAAILVNKVAEIARSIKGVTRIQLPYRRGSFLGVSGSGR